MKIIQLVLSFFVFTILSQSCASTKSINYLQGIDTVDISKINIPPRTIQPGNLLLIKVFADNMAAAAAFNGQVEAPVEFSGSINTKSTGSSSAYKVDDQGFLVFPQVGKVRVEGLTLQQVDSVLTPKLRLYLNNPYLDIRFQSMNVTILGEVNSPGTLYIPENNVNLLQAIGLAGDITVFGERKDIIIIREDKGIRTSGKIDVTSPQLFNSPFFMLQANDIVIVNMNKKKVMANDQVAFRNITVITALLSTVAILFNVFRN